jgi:hypothetical protein
MRGTTRVVSTRALFSTHRFIAGSRWGHTVSLHFPHLKGRKEDGRGKWESVEFAFVIPHLWMEDVSGRNDQLLKLRICENVTMNLHVETQIFHFPFNSAALKMNHAHIFDTKTGGKSAE